MGVSHDRVSVERARCFGSLNDRLGPGEGVLYTSWNPASCTTLNPKP